MTTQEDRRNEAADKLVEAIKVAERKTRELLESLASEKKAPFAETKNDPEIPEVKK